MTEAENTICNSKELSALDRNLTVLSRDLNQSVIDQLDFDTAKWKKYRNNCENDYQCIKISYVYRIRNIKEIYEFNNNIYSKVAKQEKLCNTKNSDECKKLENLYKKACRFGKNDICIKLVYMYKTGNKINQNDIKAFKLAKKICNNGYKEGCKQFNKLKNYSKNLVFIALYEAKLDDNVDDFLNDLFESCEMKNKEACNTIKNVFLNIDYLFDNNRTKVDNALSWYKKHANKSNIYSKPYIQTGLAAAYRKGLGVEKDYEKAIYWYKKAAEQGYSYAQSILGNMYQQGLGVEKDYAEAIYWFKKAAEQGDSYAQYHLGYMYEQGLGVEKDYVKAIYWYKKAVEQKNVGAQNRLAYMYYKGLGVEKDYVKAIKWYKKAAEQGDSVAQSNLGYMYEHGLGVEKDYVKAIYWYKKAAGQGDSDSQNEIDKICNEHRDICE